MSSYPSLKLTYFPISGHGEPIRLALFMGDITFEDKRITPDELMLRKTSLPFEQLSVFKVDGDVMGRSHAILRYVGCLSGLYSTVNSIEAFQIDEILCLI